MACYWKVGTEDLIASLLLELEFESVDGECCGILVDRGVQRVEDLINPPESDRPEAQQVDPKSIAGRIRFCI